MYITQYIMLTSVLYQSFMDHSDKGNDTVLKNEVWFLILSSVASVRMNCVREQKQICKKEVTSGKR